LIVTEEAIGGAIVGGLAVLFLIARWLAVRGHGALRLPGSGEL